MVESHYPAKPLPVTVAHEINTRAGGRFHAQKDNCPAGWAGLRRPVAFTGHASQTAVDCKAS